MIPLLGETASATPSALTSLSSTPEPEFALKAAHTRIQVVSEAKEKSNIFGNLARKCASPECQYPATNSDLCVVCEHKRHAAVEKEKLKDILAQRAKEQIVSPLFQLITLSSASTPPSNLVEAELTVSSLQKPSCAICARNVILPPVVPPAQFIICTICERKMLSANAIPRPTPKPAATADHGQPSGGPPKSHTSGQPRDKSQSQTPRSSDAKSASTLTITEQVKPPLTIRLPAMGKSRKSPTAQNTEREQPVKMESEHKASRKRKSLAEISEQLPSPMSRLPLPAPTKEAFPGSIFSRWEATEKAIDSLRNQPHYNERGEYLFPAALYAPPSTPVGIITTHFVYIILSCVAGYSRHIAIQQ